MQQPFRCRWCHRLLLQHIQRVVFAPDRASSSILGPPSLSVAFINRVLSAYHSPAVGLGSVLYADSLTYGIDDAYPLAFFLHESSMGNAGLGKGQSLARQHLVYSWLVLWWWLSLLSNLGGWLP